MTAACSTPPPFGFAPGTVLVGKYRVESELGVGGMGFVVAAQHLGLNQRVAIKFLLPHLAVVAEAAARFVREGRAATRIQGEHVVRVFDVGQLQGGVPYLVMEYLEGKDLHRMLREGHVFAIAEALDFIVQAAHALAEAHRAGVVHRDVKPANLFLTRRSDDRPLIKVLDFGISKVLDEDPSDLSLTKTTSVLGSGLYMSPEQMRSARTVDARTDIYALGVCLYELLTRTHPFTAESFSELCLKVNLEPPDPIRRHRPDVPEGLAAAIAKAYAKNPAERYGSMAAFARALAPWALPETRSVVDAIQRIARDSSADVRAVASAPMPASARAGGRGARSLGNLVGAAVAIVAVPAAVAGLVLFRPWEGRAPAAPVDGGVATTPASSSAVAPTPGLGGSAAIGASDSTATAAPPGDAREPRLATSNATSGGAGKRSPAPSSAKKPCDDNKRGRDGLKIPCDLQ